jgi:hypothetical protein
VTPDVARGRHGDKLQPMSRLMPLARQITP